MIRDLIRDLIRDPVTPEFPFLDKKLMAIKKSQPKPNSTFCTQTCTESSVKKSWDQSHAGMRANTERFNCNAEHETHTWTQLALSFGPLQESFIERQNFPAALQPRSKSNM